MKALPSIRWTAGGALLICCLSATALKAESAKPAPRTEVIFDGADNYTDWELSDGADWYRDDVFTAIRSFLTKQTDQLLPEGYHLKITFTDIDLGHRASRRVPSASGAPAFEFNYHVTDSSGKVIKQGTEDLRHYTDFGNYRASIETTDLRTEIIQPEKPILKSWAFTRLANLK
jgi:Protein of unknown function (DUF3016)